MMIEIMRRIIVSSWTGSDSATGTPNAARLISLIIQVAASVQQRGIAVEKVHEQKRAAALVPIPCSDT